MAEQLGGSRTGSLSLEGAPLMGGQEHSDTAHHEEKSLIALARRNTKRNRSMRTKKVMEDIISSRRPSCESLAEQQQHLPLPTYPNSHRRSPSIKRGGNSPILRSPSPRKPYQHTHHDIGFSDTVTNVVEIVKDKKTTQKRYPRGSWSASTSPARSPSPSDGHQPYGWHCGPMRSSRRGVYASAVVGLPVHHSAAHQSSVQHSHPMLGSRRGQGRRLPPTPCKPSTLQLRPGPINFPKLNASPTHVGLQSHSTHSAPHSLPHSFPREREPLREIPPLRDSNPNPAAPLSFEQAVALGRGGRMLPSPVPNGYKPKATISRHSDSDDDDWC